MGNWGQGVVRQLGSRGGGLVGVQQWSGGVVEAKGQ